MGFLVRDVAMQAPDYKTAKDMFMTKPLLAPGIYLLVRFNFYSFEIMIRDLKILLNGFLWLYSREEVAD